MEKLSFKAFLTENDETLNKIFEILETLTEEELNVFGTYILIEFFEIPEEEFEDLYFTIDDIKDIIIELGSEYYGIILSELAFESEESEEEEEEYMKQDFYREDDEDEETEIEEKMYAKFFSPKSFKRTRKFFKKSKAQLLAGKSQRRIKYLQKKAKIMAVKRINKKHLQLWRKSYANAVKTGKSKVQHHLGTKI